MKKLLAKSFSSWYFKIGLIALALRLILMPITAHPDIWSLNFARYFFTEQKVFNIYDFLASLPANHPLSQHYGVNFYTYPPLSYFTFGLFGFLMKLFHQPDISLWIMENYPRIYTNSLIYKQLFFLKLPYLLFDFGIAFLLAGLFNREKEKRLAYLFWLLNPVSLYSAYMVGQFELMPVFFMVLSLFLVKIKKVPLAVISLGIGSAYKMFPLFFIPILAFCLGKKFLEKIGLLVLGFIPFLVTIAPFVKSPAFREIVLFSKQSEKFLHMNLPLSGAEGIFIFVLIWGIIFFLSYYYPKKRELLWFWFLAIMLAFFSVTHYHPQWFVWLTPLLIIQLIKTKFRFLFLTETLIFSWLLITLFFESSLNYGLFIPLNPRLWNALSLADLVNRFYDVFQLKSLIRSIFAAASLVMVFYSFKFKNENL